MWCHSWANVSSAAPEIQSHCCSEIVSHPVSHCRWIRDAESDDEYSVFNQLFSVLQTLLSPEQVVSAETISKPFHLLQSMFLVNNHCILVTFPLPALSFRLAPPTSVSAVMPTSSWSLLTSLTGCCRSSPRWRSRSLRMTGPGLSSPGPCLPPLPARLWGPLRATLRSPLPLCLLCLFHQGETWTRWPPRHPNRALLQSSPSTRRAGTRSRWSSLPRDTTPTGPMEAWDSPTERLPTLACWVRAWHGPPSGCGSVCRVWGRATDWAWAAARCLLLRATGLPLEVQWRRCVSEPATLWPPSRSTDHSNRECAEPELWVCDEVGSRPLTVRWATDATSPGVTARRVRPLLPPKARTSACSYLFKRSI